MTTVALTDGRRWPSGARWPSVVATAAVVVAILAIAEHVRVGTGPGRPGLIDAFVGAPFALAGAMVLRREVTNRLGVALLCGGAVVMLNELADVVAFESDHGGLVAGMAGWVSNWTVAGYLVLITLVPLLFPDGAPGTRIERRLVRASIFLVVICAVGAAIRSGPVDNVNTIVNPLGVGPEWFGGIPQAVSTAVLVLVVTPIAFVILVRRTRRASGRERAQMYWLLIGGLGALTAVPVSLLMPNAWADVFTAVALGMMPASVAIAILRHGLLDIEVVLNRAVVFVLVTVLAVAAASVTVGVVGVAVNGRRGAAVVAALAALAVASGRSFVQRLVDRWLFGFRREPYEVVRRVSEEIDQTEDPASGLAQLAASVVGLLKFPLVEVRDAGGAPLARSGAAVVPNVEAVPIVARGRRVGTLVVGHRHTGEALHEEERSLLTEVARRAGGLIDSSLLISEAQASRERVVIGREEERRRLRRDLHDGIGPSLSGIALQLDLLTLSLGDGAAREAEALKARLKDTVVEVRRIVDDLRPPALDELGLEAAIVARAEQLFGDTAATVSTTSGLDGLPAAIEVAAYRIVSEALHNAARHAQAQHVRVELGIERSRLRIIVSDDGQGFGSDTVAGVGLASMHERAAEVGGRVEVRSAGGEGTTVTAELLWTRT